MFDAQNVPAFILLICHTWEKGMYEAMQHC